MKPIKQHPICVLPSAAGLLWRALPFSCQLLLLVVTAQTVAGVSVVVALFSQVGGTMKTLLRIYMIESARPWLSCLAMVFTPLNLNLLLLQGCVLPSWGYTPYEQEGCTPKQWQALAAALTAQLCFAAVMWQAVNTENGQQLRAGAAFSTLASLLWLLSIVSLMTHIVYLPLCLCAAGSP
jgi:hypothetical protein